MQTPSERQEKYAARIVQDIQDALRITSEPSDVEAARAHALSVLKEYHTFPRFRHGPDLERLARCVLRHVLQDIAPQLLQAREKPREIGVLRTIILGNFERYGRESALACATNAQAAPSAKPTVRQREGFAEAIVEAVWCPPKIGLRPELCLLLDDAKQPARRDLLLIEVHPEHSARFNGAWIETRATGLVNDILRIIRVSLPPGPRGRMQTKVEGLLRQYIELIQKLRAEAPQDSLAVGERIHREVEASLKEAESTEPDDMNWFVDHRLDHNAETKASLKKAEPAVPPAATHECPSCTSTQIQWNPRASVWHCPLCSWSKSSLAAPPPPPRFAVGDWVDYTHLGPVQVMAARWNDSTWLYSLLREGRHGSLQLPATAVGIPERSLLPSQPRAQQPAGGRIMPISELHKLERQAAKMMRFGSNMLGGGVWDHGSLYWPAVPSDPEKKPR